MLTVLRQRRVPSGLYLRIAGAIICSFFGVNTILVHGQNLLGGGGTAQHSPDAKLGIAEGFRRAEQEKKPIIVDFYTDWCGWCKVMDQKTYDDYRVKPILAKSFILVKYNPEKDGNVEYRGQKLTPAQFSKMMEVNGYPTTAFLKSDGSKIESVSGYIEPNKFLDILRFVTDKKYEGIAGVHLEEHLLLENIDRDPNNVRFRINLAQYYIDSVRYKKSLEIFGYAAGMKPTDPEDLFALYNGRGMAQYFFAKDYKSAVEDFRKSLAYVKEPKDKARVMLFTAMAEAGDNRESSSVESLEKFVKYCQDQQLGTKGLRAMLEQAPQMQSLRDNKNFQLLVRRLQ